MANFDVLNNFHEIRIESPVDKIIRQIRELITSGQLNPGDKLPPERKIPWLSKKNEISGEVLL